MAAAEDTRAWERLARETPSGVLAGPPGCAPVEGT
eukprot:SAG31_NODE_43115_length_268_cov_0.923077_1_plen_34_part_10